MVLLASGATQVFAQPVTSPPKATGTELEKGSTPDVQNGSAPTARTGAKEIEPPLYYLKDKDGHLQAMPGIPFADFMKAYRLLHQLDKAEEAKPRYNLQEIDISGAVRGERADLTAKFRIVPQVADWIRVPLRLTKSVLSETATIEGGGEQFIQFEEGVGYVAWVRGKENAEQIRTLNISSAVAVQHNSSRLDLSLPRAPISKLILRVPLARAVGTVSEGSSLSSSKSVGDGMCELTVLGAGGDFQMAWHEPEARSTDAPVTLESVGLVAVKIDERVIATDASYTIRSLGGEFDHLQLRLPTDVRVRAGNPTGYKLDTEITEEATVVNVALEKKTAGPVEIRFSTERDYNASRPDEWLDLAAAEVVGAPRQFGHLAVQLPGEWQLTTGKTQGFRQVEELPEALRRNGVTAGFEYASVPGQACSLPVRIARRKTRKHVDPEYVFTVSADQVQLEGKLRYSIRGAKVSRLEIDGGDWELEDVGPKPLVDIEAALATDGPAWQFPLVAPAGGDLEITFRARRKIAANAAVVEWTLPQPHADVVGTATVAIMAADNVELRPKADALVGLSRQVGAPTLKLPDRQQAPLFFRGELPDAKFVADIQVHAQSLAVQAHSQVAWSFAAIRVEQHWQYQINYVPTDRLELRAPKLLSSNGSLEMYWDGQKLPMPTARDGNDPSVSQFTIVLPKAKLGRGELLAKFSLPMEKLVSEATVPVTVPLFAPQEGDVTDNELSMTTAAGIQVELRGEAWTPLSKPTARDGAKPDRFSALKPALQADFIVSPDESRGRRQAIVERAWFQTWLTSTQRQDRAVFQFHAAGGEFRLNLPAGVIPSEVEVVLDGVQIPASVTPPDQLTVDLPAGRESQPQLLELRYRFADRRPAKGQLTVDLPHVGRDVWIRRSYWQIILPKDEHLLFSPGDWTGENVWGWRGFYWERAPALEQAALETWCGATHLPGPPEGTNRYLFSALEPPPSIEVWTASRTLLVCLASLAALAAGLALVYIPAFQRPKVWIAGGGSLLIAGLLLPDTMWLVTQAAGVGVVLTLAAALLRKSTFRPLDRSSLLRPSAASPSASAAQRAATEIHVLRPAIPGSHTSTATAPISAPELPT